MPSEAPIVVVDESLPQPDASLWLTVSLAVPAFFVVVWFLARLFNGRWIDPSDPEV